MIKIFVALILFILVFNSHSATSTYLKGTQLVESNKTLVSSGVTDTLTATSPMNIYVTGSVAQTIKLPLYASVSEGFSYKIFNKSTQSVSVIDSLDVPVSTVYANTDKSFTLFSGSIWAEGTGGSLGKTLVAGSGTTIIQDATSATISSSGKALVGSSPIVVTQDSTTATLSFSVPSCGVGQHVAFDGSAYVCVDAAVSAGQASNYFFSDVASGISTYKTLTKTAETGTEELDTISMTSNGVETFYGGYADGAIGSTVIEAGFWEFNLYRSVNATAGTTSMTIRVFKRTNGGVETELFNVNTGDIQDTVITLQQIKTVQPSFSVNASDVLVVKISATTSAQPKTVSFTHNGTARNSFISSPITVRHNQLVGLDGGAAGFYGHTTASQTEVLGQLSYASNTVTASQSLNISQTSKLANEYLVASNKVDGSFESDTAFWSTSNGTIVRTANTATTTINGNYNGVWSGTGTSTLDLQWTATASNTYEPSLILQLPTGQTAANYSICAYVGTTETGCKVIDACQLDRQCKVSVAGVDSILGSAFYLRLKHTGAGAFSAIVDSGKIEAWTPNVANLTVQEAISYTGYTSKDGSNFIKFKTRDTLRSNFSNVINVDDTTYPNYTRYAVLKDCPVTVVASGYGATTPVIQVVHYNSAGAIVKNTQQKAVSSTIGTEAMITTWASAGDYFIAQSDIALADTVYAHFSITAQATSEHIVQSYQDGMATTATYTPVFTGIGTYSNASATFLKDGEYLEVQGTVTTGSTVGSNLSISLPDGLVIKSNLPVGATGYAIVGQWARNATSALAMSVIAAPNGTTVFASLYGGGTRGSITPAFGNDVGSSESQSFKFRVPIQGWSAISLYSLPTRSEVFSASIDASEVITNATQNFVTSCTNAAPSVCTLWSSFGVAPICFAQKTSSSDAYVSASTSASVTVQRADAATPFNLFCHLK